MRKTVKQVDINFYAKVFSCKCAFSFLWPVDRWKFESKRVATDFNIVNIQVYLCLYDSAHTVC